MSGTWWIFVDLLAPAVLLATLIALIATAKPDPERALHRQPLPQDAERKGRRRRRRGHSTD